MQRKRTLQVLIGAIILVTSISIAVAILMKTRKTEIQAEAVPPLPSGVDLSLNDVRLSEIREGEKQWDLVAKHADYDRSNSKTKLKEVRMVFHSSEEGKTTLTADRATYHNNTKDVELTGHVVAVRENGTTFTTSSAKYHAKTGMITSKDRVRLVTDQLTVEGIGMELLMKDKSAKVLQQVSATIIPQGRR